MCSYVNVTTIVERRGPLGRTASDDRVGLNEEKFSTSLAATVQPTPTTVQSPISTVHCLSLNKLILACYPPSCISNAIRAEPFPPLRVISVDGD